MRLFDTIFLIDLVNKDAGAGKMAKRVDEEESFVAISVITVHEYLLGVHHRYFSAREFPDKLEAAKRDLAPFQAIPLTSEIAQESSQLQAHMERRGQILGINDLYIASTALSLKLTLVTRNTRDFNRGHRAEDRNLLKPRELSSIRSRAYLLAFISVLSPNGFGLKSSSRCFRR